MTVVFVAVAVAFLLPYVVTSFDRSSDAHLSALSLSPLLTQILLALTLAALLLGARLACRNRRKFAAVKYAGILDVSESGFNLKGSGDRGGKE
ncbi:MAG: hypothetical protein V4568_15345 [Pseudomonadota bacterium]